MTIEILMPALSPTMEEGTLAKWLVNEGDSISSGDLIAEIETDKATMEVEAVDDGKIGQLLVPAGTEGVKVNTPIALLIDSTELPHTSIKTIADKPYLEKEKITTELKIEKPVTLEPNSSIITVREALRNAMAEEMRSDKKVFVMGEEVAEYQGAYKVTQGLLDEFGNKRVYDTPITEHGFAGIGIGAAFGNLKPIVEFMTFNFAMQAMDQIVNSAAKTLYMSGGQMGCPIVFRGPNGAAARVGAQHSQDFSSWYASIPGLKVVCPFSSRDAKGLLKAAIRDPNPVIFLENEILYGKSFNVNTDDNEIIELGKAEIYRDGTDVTLVSFGIGMEYAIEAANKLSEDNINCEIINLRTIRPLDKQTIVESVKKTNRCVTIEEGYPVCAVGNYISSVLINEAFDYLDAPIINCTSKDVPMPYAENLESETLIKTTDVISAVKKVLYR